MEEIINKVANSGLEIFDLEDYYPSGKRVEIDLSQWLEGGFLLKEKEFRQQLKQHDWSIYQDCYVAVYCATDAILPAWASLLVCVHLSPFAKQIFDGNAASIDQKLYVEILTKIDFTVYTNKPVILKGCSKKPVPQIAYIIAIQRLKEHAKSIFYGEACSAVPLYKK